MCDLAIGLTLAATAIGAMGSIQQGQAQAAAYAQQASVARMNAQLERRRSQDALARGALEEQRKRQEVSAIKGKQLAQMAANNVDVGFGSPFEAQVDTATMGEIDSELIRTNANREAYDHRVAAANQDANASFLKSSAASANTGGFMDALGTAIGGASKAYGKYASTYGSSPLTH